MAILHFEALPICGFDGTLFHIATPQRIPTHVNEPLWHKTHTRFRAGTYSSPKAGWGGVAVYCRLDVNTVALHQHSSTAERSWVRIFTHVGTIALGTWYRPPDCTDTTLDSLRSELNGVSSHCIGTILMGDMNVHHAAWLGSFSTDRVGRSPKQIADDFVFEAIGF